ncbi:MAG: hypothetical protein H0T89_33560 [Deltaproteobacteria bacterium]|nr:hypothetical protein [Deltaproteobacteria bacterium]MDQ3300697.1 hypothetical protein [Myxococcota bacterium]
MWRGLLVVVAAACSPCTWSASPAGDAVAYLDDSGVVLRRDGKAHRVGFAGCLATAEDHVKALHVLVDGWSALVVGYDVRGGTMHHSNGTIEDVFACVVDFRTKISTPIDPDVLTASIRRIDGSVGYRTGRFYSPHYPGIEVEGPVADLGLVDLASSRIAFEIRARPGTLELGDVVSHGDAVWVLVAENQRRDTSGSYTARWLDRSGKFVGRSKQIRGSRLVWLRSQARVLMDETCSLDLLDLPPPR